MKLIYAGVILNSFMYILGRVIAAIFSRSPIKSTSLLVVKNLLIAIFFLTLPMSFNNQEQLSAITSTNINVSPSQYGIVYFFIPGIAVFLLFMILAVEKYKLKSRFYSNYFEITLIIFFAFCLVTTIFSFDIPAALPWLLKFALALVCFFVFSRIDLSNSTITTIISVFTITIFIESLLGWIQYLSFGLVNSVVENPARFYETNPNPEIFTKFGFFRAIGTFVHPNTLSTYILLISPFLMVVNLKKEFQQKLHFKIALVLAMTIPIITMSRWGLVSLVFSIGLLTIIFKRRFFQILNTLTMHLAAKYLLCIALIICLLNLTLRRVHHFSANDLSLVTRVELLNEAIIIIEQHPIIGVGGSGFIKFFAENDYTTTKVSEFFLAPVHNMLLLVAAEHGLFTLLVFLFWNYLLIINFIKHIKSGKTNYLIIAGIISTGVFILNSLMSMRYFGDRIGILFLAILGITINAINSIDFKRTKKHSLLSPITKPS